MQGPKHRINLLRGWPSPTLVCADLMAKACQRMLANPAEASSSILQYGPDEGYLPLRKLLAQWLGAHFAVQPDVRRICVTGGASQGLACILQSFTDPGYTRAVWMVAPTYFMAARIFADSGLGDRLRAVPEDEEGVDLDVLEARISELERREGCRHPPSAEGGGEGEGEGEGEDEGEGQDQDALRASTRRGQFKDPGPYRKLYRHVIYAVPTFANPSGKVMTLRRREALVRLARRHDALIICDDVYDFLHWPLTVQSEEGLPRSAGSVGPGGAERSFPKTHLPRLCDIELGMGSNTPDDPHGFGHAISNGSFSKLAGPGVRTGWVEGSPAFALGLSKTGSSMSGGAPSQFCAAMMADMLRDGALQEHVERTVRPALRRRHKLMMDAVREHLVPLGVIAMEASMNMSMGGVDTATSSIYGGYFVWLTLGTGLSSRVLRDAALREENLVIGQGEDFAVPGDDGCPSFDENVRLSFSWEAEENIVEGVRRLGGLIQRMRENPYQYQRLPAGV